MQREIKRFLARAEDMNLFPQSATQVRQVVDDPKATIDDLERVVQLDPTLSAQLLKVANSPYFGVAREISTVRGALMILGFDATRNMALALAMLSLSQGSSATGGRLLEHALEVALGARMLAEGADRELASEVFVAGLLHDLGRLVLSSIASDRYAPMADLQGAELVEAERQEFGFDHGALGAACLENWQLPSQICLALRYHHDLEAAEKIEDARTRCVVGAVALADEISHRPDREDADWVALCGDAAARLFGIGDGDAERLAAIGVEVPAAPEQLGFR